MVWAEPLDTVTELHTLLTMLYFRDFWVCIFLGVAHLLFPFSYYFMEKSHLEVFLILFICMHAEFLREYYLNSVLNHVDIQYGWLRRNTQSRLSDYRNIPHIDVHFLVVILIVDMMENNIANLILESRGIYLGNVLMRWLKTVFVFLVCNMYVKLINKPVVFVLFKVKC